MKPGSALGEALSPLLPAARAALPSSPKRRSFSGAASTRCPGLAHAQRRDQPSRVRGGVAAVETKAAPRERRGEEGGARIQVAQNGAGGRPGGVANPEGGGVPSRRCADQQPGALQLLPTIPRGGQGGGGGCLLPAPFPKRGSRVLRRPPLPWLDELGGKGFPCKICPTPTLKVLEGALLTDLEGAHLPFARNPAGAPLPDCA